jgi:hypothetical protein
MFNNAKWLGSGATSAFVNCVRNDLQNNETSAAISGTNSREGFISYLPRITQSAGVAGLQQDARKERPEKESEVCGRFSSRKSRGNAWVNCRPETNYRHFFSPEYKGISKAKVKHWRASSGTNA